MLDIFVHQVVRKRRSYGIPISFERRTKVMEAIERYELVRPILLGEKSVKQVHQETGVPISTLYRYLKRFGEGNYKIESLADKSNAPHSNPKWFIEEDKDKVVLYKLQHPEKSARQIAKELSDAGVLQIGYHSVSDILKQRRLPEIFFRPFFQTNRFI